MDGRADGRPTDRRADRYFLIRGSKHARRGHAHRYVGFEGRSGVVPCLDGYEVIPERQFNESVYGVSAGLVDERVVYINLNSDHRVRVGGGSNNVCRGSNHSIDGRGTHRHGLVYSSRSADGRLGAESDGDYKGS